MAQSERAICSHCSVKCGVIIELEDGKPVSVKGDASHPVSKGFICVRGQAAIEYFHHPDRLNYILKRAGARGDDHWRPIPRADAIGEIAQKLRRNIDGYGPESVAYFFGTYHGTDQGIGVRFMNLIGSPNYVGNAFICAGPRIEADWLTYGFGPALPDPVPGTTKSIVMWGQRLSSSNAPNWGRFLAAKRAGSKLIVVDPLKTPEAKAADLWLPIRPGTDAALMLGLINIVIQEGLVDDDFIAKRTIGFAELSRRVKAFTLDRVAGLTGLDTADILACARTYALGPSIMSTGLVNGMGRNALNFERARACLVAITGNIGRPGGSQIIGGPDRVQTKSDLELNELLSPQQRQKRIGADRFRLLGQGYELINEAARKRWAPHLYPHTATRGAIAHAPSVFRTILEAKPYPIKALLVQHANLVGSYSNAALTREALRSPNLDLIVAHDLFKTPTTTYADYVIPAASWMEKPWMYLHGENKLVMATRKVIEPLHDRLSDYDFFRDLGHAFGQQDYWPDSLESLYSEMLKPADLSFEELSSSSPNWFIDKQANIDPDTGTTFGTKTGRIELASTILADCGYDPLPDFDLTHVPPADGSFPLTLMSGATQITMTHQDHRQVASLRKRHPNPTAKLNAGTAAKYGVAARDWIWIESSLGRILQQVAISDTVPDDTVDAERWWYPERVGNDETLYDALTSNVNVLTIDDPELCDPAFGTWPLRIGQCRITRTDIGPDHVALPEKEGVLADT